MNLLPFDGEVLYYGKIMEAETANRYFERLMNHIEWKNDEAVMFGKHIFTKRKVAWYGDREFEYAYSNITKRAQLWTRELKELKAQCEVFCGETFNSCLLNLYHTGQEGMAWHSDDEKDLKKDGAIASLTLGAERRFSFKHRQSRERISLELTHGSLLLMKGSTQTHWMHRLPPTKKIHGPRINLTFRTIL